VTLLAPRLRAPLITVALIAALAFCALQVQTLTWPLAVGIDFPPVRNAGAALLHGHSIYGDHAFVYPPPAALLGVPFALPGGPAGFALWLLAGVGALAVAGRQLVRSAAAHRGPLAAATLMLFGGGCVATDSLWLGNASVLVVPLAVAAVVAFRNERWAWGCAVLVASLLVKPLLVPLLLVPALRRQWRPLIVAIAGGATVLLTATLTLPGATQFGRVLGYLLRGTNLHGRNARNNISLRGWAEYHHVSGALGLAASLAVVVITVAAARGRGLPHDPARLAAVLLATTLLAGAISEVHYLLSLGALTLLVIAHDPQRVRWLAPGLALLLLPAGVRDLVPGSVQTWYLVAQALILAGLLAPVTTAPVTTAPVTTRARP
jgi:hypothetical protein